MGFNEIFTNAFLLDAPMLYQHNNDYGWWEIEEKLQLARAKCLNMWSEHYPYEAASTNIGADALKPEALTGRHGLAQPGQHLRRAAAHIDHLGEVVKDARRGPPGSGGAAQEPFRRDPVPGGQQFGKSIDVAHARRLGPE